MQRDLYRLIERLQLREPLLKVTDLYSLAPHFLAKTDITGDF
jgi:hypothetical protein